MSKKIIFSAGGTGGHIFPAVNLMKYLYKKGYTVVLVADKKGVSFTNDYSEFKSYILKVDTPTNKNFLKKIFSFFIIFYSFLRSVIILYKEKPNLVIGFGGYVSFPISFMSKLFRIPLVIYESNLALGRANKYLIPFAKKIFLAQAIKNSFLKKFEDKICIVGPIINKNIIDLSNFKKNRNKESFSVLVLGGSQGAEIFGKIIPPAITMVKNKGYQIQIKQQCIKNQKKNIVDYYKKNNIQNYVFEFDKNLLELILDSDLAITRCGASTTAELAHMLTPFIAVPLPESIDNHQYLNAKFYEEKGCCYIMEQSNFNTKNLFNLIIEIIKNKNKLNITDNNAEKSYKNNVYDDIESQIKEFI